MQGKYIPPWTEPYIIGVAGFSGSGKTSVAHQLIEQINQPWTVLLSLDNFYRPLNEEQKQQAFRNEYDFDKPTSLDLDLLYRCVRSLKEGRRTEIPIYSFSEHNRTERTITIYGAHVIIIEGIYALYNEELLNLMDIKIYVDTDLDVCLARRLTRDIVHRERDLEGILKQWDTFVKPNSVHFVKPCLNVADVVIPRGRDNVVAIDMLIKHVSKQLQQKSKFHLERLNNLGDKSVDVSRIQVLPQTNQIRGINSMLLAKDTLRSDFIFYFDRIASLLINHALELVQYKECEIVTPLNATVKGLCPAQKLVGVNMIRSGDCFMNSLRRTIPEVPIGKLLIQSDSLTGEPQLHTESLPQIPPNCKILLFDAQVISGAAAIMGVQVLVDHGVKEEDVIFVSYLCSEIGARRVLNAFPGLNLVTGGVGKMDEREWFRKRFVDSIYFGSE